MSITTDVLLRREESTQPIAAHHPGAMNIPKIGMIERGAP
jgi:hypothetical protein